MSHGAAVLDPLGSNKTMIRQANVLRFNNDGYLVTFLYNSALKTMHPDPKNCAPSLWHDFHNTEQASGRIAGVSIQGLDNTTKTGWDTYLSNT